jgi:hypothetical protein
VPPGRYWPAGNCTVASGCGSALIGAGVPLAAAGSEYRLGGDWL